jgi:predicted MFS family arabinose efflux permease
LLLAPKAIAKTSTLTVLITGGLIQAVFTAALIFLGSNTAPSIALLLPATFFGGVGNMLVIVGFMVTATSGLPDKEQGLATGLATMSQQIGITMGTPIMAAIVTAVTAGATTAAAVLDGVTTAIAINAALVGLGVLIAATFLRTKRQQQ